MNLFRVFSWLREVLFASIPYDSLSQRWISEHWRMDKHHEGY